MRVRSTTGGSAVAVYCSPAADVMASHGVRHVRHCQYADDTQLHLAMRASGLSVLAACTADVKLWFMQNGLQLNQDKSEALIMGTATGSILSDVGEGRSACS